MNHNTEVKYTTLEDFVMTVNDLGVELVIEEALINKNENDFIQYTNEFKQLEAFLSE